MNILKKIFKKNNNSNVAWKTNEPTKFVVYCFKYGLIKNGDKVIDIGCGFGRNSNWLAFNEVNVTAVNISDEEIKIARREADKLGVSPKYTTGNFLKVNFNGELFNVALDIGCSHMLPKIDQLAFADKVASIIRHGGYLIYFGFSKKHPAYDPDKKRVMYRDLDDLLEMYGKNFEVLNCHEISWKPSPEEHSKFQEHIGLNVVFRRK